MQKKYTTFILLFLILLFCFLVQFQFGTGYQREKAVVLPFNSSAFFSWLQNITGTLFIWPDQKVLSTYHDFLNTTSASLHLRNYEITYQPFKDYFLRLAKQEIPLHIILEDKIYNAYQNFFKQLQIALSGEQHIHLQSDDAMGTTYQHSKVMFNENAFRIQTANLTKSSFESNREHFFYSSSAAVRTSLAQLFEKDWAGEGIKTTDLHPNLVVCPVNCRQVVETLLRSAKESIIIQTQYILDDRILQILRAQSESVKLHIIVADTLDNTDVVSYFWPAVARKLTSRYNHTKMILIDEKYLLLGSMNLSDNSLDNNREIWIMLVDTAILQQFQDGFRKDRKNG